jgi:hypothetical protein
MEISSHEEGIAIAHRVRQSPSDQLLRQGHIDAELKLGLPGADMKAPPLFWDQTESCDPFVNRRCLSARALPISVYTCCPSGHAFYLQRRLRVDILTD